MSHRDHPHMLGPVDVEKRKGELLEPDPLNLQQAGDARVTIRISSNGFDPFGDSLLEPFGPAIPSPLTVETDGLLQLKFGFSVEPDDLQRSRHLHFLERFKGINTLGRAGINLPDSPLDVGGKSGIKLLGLFLLVD